MPLLLPPLLLVLTYTSNQANGGREYTSRTTALRAHLLDGYDKAVVAVSNRDSDDISQSGTVVSLQTRFFKVDNVDPQTGSMQVKVWLRLRWQDTRLAWDPAAWGNVSQISFNHPTLEETEIWTPDLVPFNARGTMADMFESTIASVDANGLVTWSRPGMLDVMCKFSGLVMFPRDELQCGIDMGSWTLTNSYQDIRLWDDGYIFSHTEDTSGTTYQEFSIHRIQVDRKILFYDVAFEQDERWSVIHYQITLRRAFDFYIHVLVWPAVLITLSSFCVFLISPECGERLGYGITTILAMEVMKVVIDNFVPSCGEFLWSDLFTVVNEWFCFLALFESAIVLTVFHYQKETITPLWLLHLLGCMPKPGELGRALKSVQQFSDSLGAGIGAGVAITFSPALKPTNPLEEEKPAAADKAAMDDEYDPLASPYMHNFSLAKLLFQALNKAHESSISSTSKSALGNARGVACARNAQGQLCSARQLGIDDVERFLLYETLFYELDDESQGYLDIDRTRVFFSFMTFDRTPAEVQDVLSGADQYSTSVLETFASDTRFVRWEFIEVCSQLLWRYPLPLLRVAATAYHTSVSAQREERKNKWIQVGRVIDYYFLVTIVPSYMSALVLLSNVQLGDEPYQYMIPESSGNSTWGLTGGSVNSTTYPPEQFMGIHSVSPPHEPSPARPFLSLLLTISLLLSLASWQLSFVGNGVLISCIIPLASALGFILHTILRGAARRGDLIKPSLRDVNRANRHGVLRAEIPRGREGLPKDFFAPGLSDDEDSAARLPPTLLSTTPPGSAALQTTFAVAPPEVASVSSQAHEELASESLAEAPPKQVPRNSRVHRRTGAGEQVPANSRAKCKTQDFDYGASVGESETET